MRRGGVWWRECGRGQQKMGWLRVAGVFWWTVDVGFGDLRWHFSRAACVLGGMRDKAHREGMLFERCGLLLFAVCGFMCDGCFDVGKNAALIFRSVGPFRYFLSEKINARGSFLCDSEKMEKVPRPKREKLRIRRRVKSLFVRKGGQSAAIFR
jgi:hypothetical protein